MKSLYNLSSNIMIVLVLLLVLIYLLSQRTYRYTGGAEPKLTYALVKNDPYFGLDETELVKLLRKNFKRVDFGTSKIDLAIGYLVQLAPGIEVHPNEYKHQKAGLKSTTANNSVITNRMQLFDRLAAIPAAAQYTPKYAKIDQNTPFAALRDFGPLIICKAAKTSGGEGVFIIANTAAEYDAIRPKFANKKNPAGDAVVTDYIKNVPLTPDGRKFHLRAYVLCFGGKDHKYRAYMFDRFRVYTAAEPYEMHDFGDKNIHDTHIKSTNKRWEFPRDFPRVLEAAPHIMDDLRGLVKCVAEAGNGISSYEDADAAFEVFAIDILIGRDVINMDNKTIDSYFPYILEVNNRVSYNSHGPRDGWLEYNREFSRDYFKWVTSSVIFPYFGMGEWPQSLV